MSFFSRLTDIVTCNLTELLADADDPRITLEEIIEEMRQGVASAQRTVKAAMQQEENLRVEVEEQKGQAEYWAQHARGELQQGDEEQARQSLRRKREVLDLVAGLEREHESARRTAEERVTTLHALEARLADAIRRRAALGGDSGGAAAAAVAESNANRVEEPLSLNEERDDAIEAELAALRREIRGS
jgi:phage shock protein A